MNFIKRFKKALGLSHTAPKNVSKPGGLLPSNEKVIDFIDDFVWVDQPQLDAMSSTTRIDEKSKDADLSAALSEAMTDTAPSLSEIPTPMDLSEFKQRTAITERLKAFSLTEALAHSDLGGGAYGAPKRKNHQTVEIKGSTEEPGILYRVVKLNTNASGLVGEILCPVDPKQSDQIIVNWTGTHNGGTLLADLERAPGEDSYRAAEIELLNQINTQVAAHTAQTQQPVNLLITGHSLGGALAQLNFHSLQRATAMHSYSNNLQHKLQHHCPQWIAAEQAFRTELNSVTHMGADLPEFIRTHLTPNHIKSMTLGVWNSAGVLNAISKSSNALAPIISDAGIKQKALFGMVAGDAVQTTGQGTILSNVDAKIAEVSLIKVDKGHEGAYRSRVFGALGASGFLLGFPTAVFGGVAFGMGTILHATAKAHTSNHFIELNSDNFYQIKHEFYNNATPQGQAVINKKLSNKSKLLQCTPITWGQKNLHKAMRYFIDNKPQPVIKPEVLKTKMSNH
jgi:hypothetical protein